MKQTNKKKLNQKKKRKKTKQNKETKYDSYATPPSALTLTPEKGKQQQQQKKSVLE